MANVIVGLNDKCIDINSRTATNGAPVVLWEQYWATSQMWNLTSDGYIESLSDTNQCLDIKDVRSDNGAPIQVWAKAGGLNQKWSLDGDNCLVSHLNRNMCIDVAGANSQSGTQLLLWEKYGAGNPNQKWYFQHYGNPNSKNRLNSNEALHFNDSLESEDGRCKFIMQGDGNLVLYFPNGETPWGSGTENTDASYAIMQGGGNFVMYNAQGQWKWDSATDGHPGAYLEVQTDGNVVIYDTDRTPLWATNTNNISPLSIINLSYKIFTNPVSGILPRQNMPSNIHSAVQQMNLHTINLNTNFRFRLIEEPVLIGGPEASGHVNFWFNTRFMNNHLKELDNMASSFFDPNNKFDNSNIFAWRDNALNIYLTGQGYGGESSFPGNGNIIGLAIDADSLGVHLQIHEIGHFFGLPHTQPEDGIADTLPDRQEWDAEGIAKNNFPGRTIHPIGNLGGSYIDMLTPEEQQLVENTWSNIMSYHSDRHPITILTKGQLSKWDLEMGTSRSNVLK